MDVFFLAAGLGTRFKPITDVWPKPCIPFLNVPMGLYHFRYLKNIQFNELVINTHHHADKIQSLYKHQPYYKEKIRFSYEPMILDTAGGLKNAFKNKTKNSTILMMNADEIIFSTDDRFLDKAIKEHDSENRMATLVVMKHPEAGKKFGAIWCDNQNVKNIGKTNSDPNLLPWHYLGIMIINPKLLDLIEEGKPLNIFYDVLINHLKDYNIKIYPIEATWYETGNAIDFLSATQQELSKLTSTQSLKNFINQYDESILKNNNLVSRNVSAEKINLAGFNVIAKDTILKSDKLENSVLFSDQVIRA